MEPHGQACGPIQPFLWGDISRLGLGQGVKGWRIPPPGEYRKVSCYRDKRNDRGFPYRWAIGGGYFSLIKLSRIPLR